MKRMTLGLTAITFLALCAGPSWAQKASEQPDATIEYVGGSIAIGLGYSFGQGVLHFKGTDYRFIVNGLSIGDIGGSSAMASGKVYHLNSVEDFSGSYFAFTAGATVIGGAAGASMRNQNGVIVHLVAATLGLQLTLAPSGVVVTIDGPPATTKKTSLD